MAGLPAVSGAKVVKALEGAGFAVAGPAEATTCCGTLTAVWCRYTPVALSFRK